jgi:uncharacterized membrane protein YfcA
MDQALIELMLLGLLCGLLGGATGGILAGLAGVGGGLIYVPLFYFTMPAGAENMSMHILGSLVAVAMTGFFSARAHFRLGHMHMASFKQLYPGLIIGAAIGLWTTLKISEAWILLTLALLDLWVARDYGKEQKIRGSFPLAVASGPIGYISGALGVGGGTMLVPLLRRVVSLREAVGTSSACGMLMALGAVLFNLLLEPAWQEQPKEQIYYLAGAWLGILIVIPKTSGWSAWLHATVSETVMRSVLKTLFYVLATGLMLAAVSNLIQQG